MEPLAWLVLLAGGLWLTGCATPPANPPAGDTAITAYNGTWQPELLYLLPTPHPRLYVEVVAVAGCAPSAETLGKLREFLTTYCEKPDGIEIVRSPLIPRSAARGMSPHALARQYLQGPPSATGPAPAYMLVLYYDSSLSEQPLPAAAGQPVAPPKISTLDQHPHSDLLPYPAIYMNVHYRFEKIVPDEMLLHEAGHMLGLVSRTEMAADHHCLDRNCLMNRALRVSWHTAFTGARSRTTQVQICGRCMQELVGSLKLPPLTNLYYAGPVLLRPAAGYTVLALPHRVKVLIGDLTPADCEEFAATVRAEPPRPDDHELRVWCTVTPGALQDRVRLRNTIQHAQADPLGCVRTAADRVWQKWQQQPRGHAEIAALAGVNSSLNLKPAVTSH